MNDSLKVAPAIKNELKLEFSAKNPFENLLKNESTTPVIDVFIKETCSNSVLSIEISSSKIQLEIFMDWLNILSLITIHFLNLSSQCKYLVGV